MAVQLQWGLETTSNLSVSALTGLLQAASSDNIQPKAILACCGLGRTIAMCKETCEKIERTVIPAPPLAPLRFMKVLVGYAANDCISQFNEIYGGREFLGLAAALVTMGGLQNAADVLHSVLVKSAQDQSLVPTMRQTMDLLACIQGRCYRAEFPRELCGWVLLLEPLLAHDASDEAEDDEHEHWNPQTSFNLLLPSNAGIESLVDALSKLHRLGESHYTKLVVRAGGAIPWTTAFVKWCLGRPPSVMLEDGSLILDEPTSRVEVIVTHSNKDAYEVNLQSSVPSLSTLIRTTRGYRFGSMIRVADFGRLAVRELGISSQILAAIAPVAIRRILQHLTVVLSSESEPKSLWTQLGLQCSLSPDGDFTYHRLSPFPVDINVLEAAGEMLGLDLAPESEDLSHCPSLLDFPLVKPHFEKLRRQCGCRPCLKKERSFGFGRSCLIQIFIDRLVNLFTAIFVLSLFDTRDDLLVKGFSGPISLSGEIWPLPDAIASILETNATAICHIDSILEVVGWLLDHHQVQYEHWIMSCHKDQAIWPAIYEDTRISDRGYLRLYWARGKLHFRDDTYEEVLQSGFNPRIGEILRNFSLPVSGPCNLFSGLKCQWHVHSRDLLLKIQISIEEQSRQQNDILQWSFMPRNAILALASALWAADCCHARDAKMAAPDEFSVFSNPFRSHFVSQSLQDQGISVEDSSHGSGSGQSSGDEAEVGESRKIRVVATDRNDELRFAALLLPISNTPLVIRGNACLECCLKVCRETGRTGLIL